MISPLVNLYVVFIACFVVDIMTRITFCSTNKCIIYEHIEIRPQNIVSTACVVPVNYLLNVIMFVMPGDMYMRE